MKIIGTKEFEIEISNLEAKRITIKTLCDMFNWQTNYTINSNNKVVETKIYHASHSWEGEIVIRNATQTDHHILAIIKKLLT